MPRFKVFIEIDAVDAKDAFGLAATMVSRAGTCLKASVEDVWEETDDNTMRRLEHLRLGTKENKNAPHDTPWEVVEVEKEPGTFIIYGKSGNRIMAYGDEVAMRTAAACVNEQALRSIARGYKSLNSAAKAVIKAAKELSDRLEEV